MDSVEPIRSVLFLDYDNIVSDLNRLNGEAAKLFAAQPSLWVNWLEGGMGGLTRPRRFLVKNLYLNPAVYGSARAVFTRSGFKAVDCPSLTSQGKSSADIHMVLDIIDALRHECEYEEFIIMSADADFTPVLHRLRAHNRRSVVITAGPAAAAYRAVADHIVWPSDLVSSALTLISDAPSSPETDSTVELPPALDEQPPSTLSVQQGDLDGGQTAIVVPQSASLEAVVAAVRAAVGASEYPMWSSAVADAARRVEPRVKELGWFGAGNFRSFVSLHLPQLEFSYTPSPGIIRDPQRHAEIDMPRKREDLASVPERVALVTGIPRLGRETYRSVFQALADAVTEDGLSDRTSQTVCETVLASGLRVTADQTRQIISALVACRVQLHYGVGVAGLQTVWFEYVVDLCKNAGLLLTEHELDEVSMWLRGVPA
ncbi:NYN domain-containing protein [Georgenia faecalis]|uniref:NYN domain-containing protein n=1 Tax=Georgenia faecalis TaxID=2483799 RepID=UPI0013E01284|nr:NYN domain-containing protein [Georgenia faecalis]